MSDFLISSEEIAKRVEEMAREITRDFWGTEPLVVGVLKGAFVFMADLIRRMELPLEVDFVEISSYRNASVPGEIVIKKDLSTPLAGRRVLLVEDIVDTGGTLDLLVRHLARKGPAEIRVAVLLDKKERRKVPVKIDYVGFEVPDKFLVGYGLDYAGKYRNLPYIRALGPEEINE